MTSYAQAAAEVRGTDQPRPPTGGCCVAGCQLPGTMVSATLGGGLDWQCRLHFGSAYADQAQITALASNRIGLYRIAMRCANASPARQIPPEVINSVKTQGRADLLDAAPAIEGKPLTLRTLAAHMLAVLDSECRHAQREIKQQATSTPPDGWGAIKNLVKEGTKHVVVA